ncbi:MAG: hypothetical protein RMJ36_07170, partial [Candidatus Calescibacterium sp.]|nr:hypothetical protein [Candidatus Calescibacterium sp.]MDW8133415.1 hypothetical protein [Candidatus Calescibacterium sp.]
MNILLDFDGVLFDSSWEVTAIILLTYINSFPNSNISKHFAKLNTSKILRLIGKYEPEHAFRVFEGETKNLNRYFRKFRTYCIDVDDFFVISYLIDNNYFDLKSLNYKTVNDEFYYSSKKRIIEEKSDDLKLFIQ